MRAAPLLLMLPAAGIIAVLPPIHAAVSFTLVESTPRVISLNQFHSQLMGDWNQEGLTVVRSATWELRDVSHHRLVGRIPVRFWHGDNEDRKGSRIPVGVWGPGFTADELRHLGPIGAGDFQLALVVNGVRSNNVVTFSVDPRYDPSTEPVLQVGKIEPAPGQKLGWLAWWATGPKSQDPNLTNMDVAGPAIWADGRQVRAQGVGAWAGAVGPIPAGQTEVGTCTAGELAGIDPRQPHDFHVVVEEGKSMSHPFAFASKLNIDTSQTARLNLSDTALSQAWDAATSTLGPAPPAPPPLLAGRVLGTDGKLAIGWVVELQQNDWPGLTEVTDADGRYAFPGVAPGTYTLVASRTGRTPTHLDFNNVTLAANETRHLDLAWKPPYSFTGSVTDAQGHPRNHIEVAAEWKDHLTGATCTTTDLTWRDGSYTLAGPFPDIVSVTVLGRPALPGRPNVKPGDRHVDFTLPAH